MNEPIVTPAMPVNPVKSEAVIAALKASYFEKAAHEDIGATPELTEEIDQLEGAIKELMPK